MTPIGHWYKPQLYKHVHVIVIKCVSFVITIYNNYSSYINDIVQYITNEQCQL